MVHNAFNPELGRQRWDNLCDFETGLVYVVSSRTVRAMYRDPVSFHHTTPLPKERENTEKNYLSLYQTARLGEGPLSLK